MLKRFSLLMCLVLFLPLLTTPSARGNCRCFRAPLDLVFVIDRSVSMVQEINQVKQQLQKIVGVIQKHSPRLRVGVVSYESNAKMIDLTSDYAKVTEFLNKIKIRGGKELVDKALETAVDKMSWDPNHRQVMILIGDEPPNSYRQGVTRVNGRARAYRMASRARKKGITVHTISTIQGKVYLNRLSSSLRLEYSRLQREAMRIRRLRRTNPTLYAKKYNEWMEKYNRFMVKAAQQSSKKGKKKKAKKIKSFVTIAQRGGGKSVALHGSNQLIKTLLYFSTGVRYDLDEGKEEEKKTSPSLFVVAQIKHEGDWNPPRDFPALMEESTKNLNISVRSQPVKVEVKDKTIFNYPFLYLTGHKSFNFTSSEVGQLSKHLKRGGFLFIDCCCGREAFDRSVRDLVKVLFPSQSLQTLPSTHSIYKNPFRLSEVKATRIPMQSQSTTMRNYLEGVKVDGRLVIVYSNKCVGCGIDGNRGSTCGIDEKDATRLFQNIIFHALTE